MTADTQTEGASDLPAISADGRHLVFASVTRSFSGLDNNRAPGLFAVDFLDWHPYLVRIAREYNKEIRTDPAYPPPVYPGTVLPNTYPPPDASPYTETIPSQQLNPYPLVSPYP